MFRFLPLMLWLATPAMADIDGVARVVDGDTLRIGAVTIRLHGIDAPETDQFCENAQGANWPCGAFVTEEVARRYDGQVLSCREIERDRYGRSVAKCYLNGQDVGEQIVADGWAQAYRRYSMDYDLVEKSAQVLGLGLWSSEMQSPAAFRADQRAAPTRETPSGECIIKGNISASGQIYHMPHNEHYANTQINEARGERWFCSEAEARAAGWRAARN